MVCNLTIGKRKYRDVEDEVRSVLAKAEELRDRLTGMIEDDVNRLQCGDGALTRKRAAPPSRTDARDRGSLRCCHAAREVIDLAAVASAKGNLNVISNAGVAALAAYAALRSAALNGYTNGKMISDKAFAEAKLKELGIVAEGVTEGSLSAGEEQA